MKRLYNAICSLIEAKAQATTNPAPEPEPQMEGSYSQAEQAGVFEPHELHAANSHDSIDNDYGAQIGFTMPPTPSGDSLLTETYRRW